MFEDGIHLVGRLLFPLFLGNDVQFHRAAVRSVPLAAAHGNVVGRERGKHAVDRFEHSGRRTEIGGETERGRERLLLVLEKLRIAPAESVDRLFRVPHEEHLVAAERGQNAVLHGVDVLILVHEHGGVFCAGLPARLLVFKDFQRELFEVVVVQNPRFPLFFRIRPVVGERQPAERGGAPVRVQIARVLFLAGGVGSKLFLYVFEFLARARKIVDGGALLGRRPAFGRRARKGRERGGARLHCKQIFRQKRFARLFQRVRRGGELLPERGIQQPPHGKPPPDLLQAGAKVARKAGTDLAERVPRAHGGELFLVPRQPARLRVQTADDGAERIVLLLAEIDGEQRSELLAPLFVRRLEHGLHRAGGKLHARGVVRSDHAKGGVCPDQIEIGAHQTGAEGVYGADFGERERRELRFEPFALLAAPFPDALQKRLSEPIAHLRRRLVGECDGENALYVRSAEHEGDEPLDHDERFSAPRRSGDDHVSARPDRALLFGCERYAHSFPPLARATAAMPSQVTPVSLRGAPTNPHAPRNAQ